MGNQYDGILQFQGRWREYQQRVLTHAETYLADRKVHIVAAPGSGKTTLGIELIRRLGAPCLILSPSITIRQQWLERVTEGFLLEGHRPEELLSNDLKQMRPITAITYQALYSAMKHYQGRLRDEEDGEEASREEEVDYRDFDLFEAVRAAGVKTVCLDEAHHLRSEWWKALESFLGKLTGITTISLTATPPYDSTPSQWKRYIDLCGPIDEEIFTPELVREGSLCPHEDYIYFNWPSKGELRQIEEHQKKVGQLQTQLLSQGSLAQMIATHQGLQRPEEYSDRFLENPQYFSALLIFCQDQGIPFPSYFKELIGTKGRLPKLNAQWLEILLQGFLFDDADSYWVLAEQRLRLLQQLKDAGCIYRKKVVLTKKEQFQKLLVKSQGKLESIGTITVSEYQALGDRMRLLILCDYIKKDQLPLVGTGRELRAEIGAVPIFESLRRLGQSGIRLGCLSGTVVLLPMGAQETLSKLLEERGCGGTLLPLGDTGYGQFQMKGKSGHLVAAVTELFRQGEINALVGTKSLLGEGWDAPCVNSLILATYVGSFMLSNQMRGRTIRTDREHPEKTGNIWHLACIYPQKGKGDFSGDYETLVRRFDAFLGVSWQDNLIESGIDRLGMPELDSRKKTEQVNQLMLERAADRDALRRRWQNALKEIHGGMEVQQLELVPKEEVKAGYLFLNALAMEALSLILALLLGIGRIFVSAGAGSGSLLALGLGLGALGAAFLAAKYGVRLFRFSTPERRMKQLGQAVLGALIETGELEDPSHCRVQVESAEGLLIGVCLKGGTMRDRTAFACCMEELWGIIDNPRYLLMSRARFGRSEEYYSVPEVFGRQKERAAVFEKHARRALGKYQLVYTRTPEGRKTLLRARTRSFVNKNQQLLLGKKVAKGKYE